MSAEVAETAHGGTIHSGRIVLPHELRERRTLPVRARQL